MDAKQQYREKLLDPRWQKKRLEILERDMWACQICFDSSSTLHVHHRWYEIGADPWEYPEHCLLTLCADCHANESEAIPLAVKRLAQSLKEAGAMSVDFTALACVFEESPGMKACPDTFDIIAWGISNLIDVALEGGDAWRGLRDEHYAELRRRNALREAMTDA